MGWDTTLRALLSLAAVFGLILAAGLVARRVAQTGGLVIRKGGKRRLAVVESLNLDGRRRLMLIRKDGAEHLLLIGGSHDLLVEQGAAAAGFALPVEGHGEQR
jgi:flagellar protein FliO/FliZ